MLLLFLNLYNLNLSIILCPLKFYAFDVYSMF